MDRAQDSLPRTHNWKGVSGMARRIRGRNEGSISQRPNGTWRGQITLQGKRLSYSAKTRKEVQAWIKKTTAEVDNGMTAYSASIAFQQFLENWLTSKKSSVRATTFSQYEIICRLHIVPAFKNLKY